MRRILIYLLPILVIVAGGFVVLGVVQVRAVRERFMDDLARKTRALAESVSITAADAVARGDTAAARKLVESFQRRERLQGCILYDREGRVFAVTERIARWAGFDRPYAALVVSTGYPRGGIESIGEISLYSYLMPLRNDAGEVVGAVEVVHDTEYLFAALAELWRRISLVLIALVSAIVIVAAIVERQTYVLPVRSLTAWFGRFQRGELDRLTPFRARGELGKLVSEVEQIALSLRVARRAVAGEAHERVSAEGRWTEAKLRDLVLAKLGESGLFVVSNREPFMHVIDEAGGEARCVRPASGVVTAIDPILRACGGTWIAHGGANADRRFVNSRNKLGVPPGDDRYILKRVWLTKEEEEGYYYGFSNEGLWPLCHVTHTRPVFRESDWRMYRRANEKFAESVLEELPARSPFVFIQDYHFMLLPRMIKERRPDATVALFWHIPWPNPEVFAICPYQAELLDGMLGSDLLGFHVQYHCNNFLDTANRLTECRVDAERFSVVRGREETFVRSFPISVNGYASAPAPADLDREIARVRRELGLEGKIVAVGVDRIDYTKGLKERILAVDRFLEKNPSYRGRFVLVQIAAPSRTHIKSYHDLSAEIDELVQETNWKYSDDGWSPIVYRRRHFTPEEIRPYYALADLCVVSSLHDGMNLVAKEFVAAAGDRPAMLVLSRFTGAARELTDAVLVNPYSIEEFADAIRQAVEMPAEERRRRMAAMREVVSDNNVYRWAANIVTELTAIRKGAVAGAAAEAGAAEAKPR